MNFQRTALVFTLFGVLLRQRNSLLQKERLLNDKPLLAAGDADPALTHGQSLPSSNRCCCCCCWAGTVAVRRWLADDDNANDDVFALCSLRTSAPTVQLNRWWPVL